MLWRVNMWNSSLWLTVAILPLLANGQSNLRRCFTCRSRGQLGNCQDPFEAPPALGPGQQAEPHTRAVFETPCSSGWCSKVVEGGDKNSINELDTATERNCMQWAPSDGKERCAYVNYNHQEVFMCFCQGDLCNGATRNTHATSIAMALALLMLARLN